MGKSEPRKVHIAEIKSTRNGVTYTSVYLRRTFREDGKVKHETLGNLSDLPPDLIELMRRRLAQGEPLSGVGEKMTILRSLPHGNVDAVLTTLRTIGLEQIIASRPCRERDLVIAMIADRVISPGSKLSCSRGMNEETAQNTLADELSLGDVDVHELYSAMDWLLERQNRIENKLAKKHLKGGSLVLFDVSSSYYTGKKSSLRQYGYSRDHRSDRPQIVYGLLLVSTNDDRIRAHVFLCMLAYYVEWHMRDRLRELLFDDPDREATQKSRRSVVAPAARSKSAREKDATLRTSSGFPVQSFQDLLKDLSTLNRNTVRLESSGAEFDQLTEATPVQRRIFELLATRP